MEHNHAFHDRDNANPFLELRREPCRRLPPTATGLALLLGGERETAGLLSHLAEKVLVDTGGSEQASVGHERVGHTQRRGSYDSCTRACVGHSQRSFSAWGKFELTFR